MADQRRGSTVQVIGSLLVALLIVALTIAIVTARIGPDADDAEDARQEGIEEQREAEEERQDDAEDARDDAEDARSVIKVA